MIFVFLESDEFGSERFEYDSTTEAEGAIGRLMRKCLYESEQGDGFNRTLRIECWHQDK